MIMKVKKLGDLGEFKNGVNFSSNKMGSGIPLINVKDITKSHRIFADELDLVDVPCKENDLANDDDLFFVRSSVKLDGIGLVAKVNDFCGKDAIHCGFVIRFRRNSDEINTNYLLYLLLTYTFRERIKGISGGTAIVNISQNALKNLEIPVPQIDIQNRVESILSNYDSLVENNLRRIELLEESARLLYREWFVHLRFPGHEHTKITNGVPKVWRKKRLSELAYLTMGQSPKSQYYNEEGEGLPFHQGVTDFGTRFVSHKKYCTVLNRIAEECDILCSVRAPVGRLNITLDKIVIGRGLSALRSMTNNQSFLYYQLKNHFFQEDIIGGGTIYASTTRQQLEGQEFLQPESKLIELFEEFSDPIDEQIKNLFLQNQQLRKARDILLPRLMNGDIAV